eukprot:UN01673
MWEMICCCPFNIKRYCYNSPKEQKASVLNGVHEILGCFCLFRPCLNFCRKIKIKNFYWKIYKVIKQGDSMVHEAISKRIEPYNEVIDPRLISDIIISFLDPKQMRPT